MSAKIAPYQSSSTGRPDGFLFKKYLADNGVLIGVNVRGGWSKEKNSDVAPNRN
jgi:hypothetical protein